MKNLLEITGEDIAKLNDADFRNLIGRLCEADYRYAGLSVKGITYGGHQDAPDGGLDVNVCGNDNPPTGSFILRCVTGFQIKKSQMPPSAIKKEMLDGEKLKEAIASLLHDGGAYIIVSSESATDSSLSIRIKAMKAIVPENSCVDFYDQNRVASWVRNHPSLILWVRNKIGYSLQGWDSYKNWSNKKAEDKEEYILDEQLRVYDGASKQKERLIALDGLSKIRAILAVPGKSVRLVGLSGVGKTRFVQALFDDRIGERSLNPSNVFYTDTSYNPDPQPENFAEQLIATGTKGVLIIDNCPPNLHGRLTAICSGNSGKINLLTIEYDIREDIPDETEVFRLEPASEEAVRILIERRFPNIGYCNARRIADYSGGNARIAIAISNTLKRNENLSRLQDDDLFKRLFWQRGVENENLLKSAAVCSLVYSFEGTDTQSEKSELKFLANFIGKSTSDIYADINTLKDRDLVQSRGNWRALLPHAIANRLAKEALNFISLDVLLKKFQDTENERLLKSFTRRLSYLHDCEKAVEIAKIFLKEDGFLGESVIDFNDLKMKMFNNIAPISPQTTLEAIERVANGKDGKRFTSRENEHYYRFVSILKSLAYDAALFDRSVKIICRYALSEKPEENTNSTRAVLTSLFQCQLSGTHAPISARAKIITELLESDKQDEQELALLLLNSALEAWHFFGGIYFDFGSRARDHGFRPKSYEEEQEWYENFIRICVKTALSNHQQRNKARKLLADKFRGLWRNAGMFETLETAAKKIHQQEVWRDGWVSVCQTIQFDNKTLNKDTLEKLQELKKILAPSNLAEIVRTYILSDVRGINSITDFSDDFIKKIGRKVAGDPGTLQTVLPELVIQDGNHLYQFMIGLTEQYKNKQELWQKLRSAYEIALTDKRCVIIFRGFLKVCAESDPDFYHKTLDDLTDDCLFVEHFPYFQTAYKIDSRGLERLHKVLDQDKALINTYKCISRYVKLISDDDLAAFVEKILSKKYGINVALEMLSMAFFYDTDQENCVYSEALMKAGRNLLVRYNFSGKTNNAVTVEHYLEKIINVCLRGEDAENTAKKIYDRIINSIKNCTIDCENYSGMLKKFAQVQPTIFLDILVKNNISDWVKHRVITCMMPPQPIEFIPHDDVLQWCDRDPVKRYPLIVKELNFFRGPDEYQELNPIIFSIFTKAPELEIILKNFSARLYAGGINANILENRAKLIQQLFDDNNPIIGAWAKREHIKLETRITEDREREKAYSRLENQRFE